MDYSKYYHQNNKKAQNDVNLANLDETQFEELDPLLNDQTKVVSKFKLGIHMKFVEEDQQIKEVDNAEYINLRLLSEKAGSNSLVIKLELYSDYDLFFYYTHLYTN